MITANQARDRVAVARSISKINAAIRESSEYGQYGVEVEVENCRVHLTTIREQLVERGFSVLIPIQDGGPWYKMVNRNSPRISILINWSTPR